MDLIFGGAYQGKLQYAKAAYQLNDNDIFFCQGPEIDFSHRCVCRLEEFVRSCLSAGIDPQAYLEAHRENWQNTIFLCRDISGGVVPIEPELRQWRQATGRLCQYLSREAQGVVRMFCGLEQRLK